MTYYVIIKRTEANLSVRTRKDSYSMLNKGKTKLPSNGYILYSSVYSNKSIGIQYTCFYMQKVLHDIYSSDFQ